MCKHVRLILKCDFHQSRVLGHESEMRRHQVIGCEQKHHIIIFRADYARLLAPSLCVCVYRWAAAKPQCNHFLISLISNYMEGQ